MSYNYYVRVLYYLLIIAMTAVISATKFRSNIFQFLDQSYTKNKPFRIKRRNQIFRIIPEESIPKEKPLTKKFIFSEYKGHPSAINGQDDLDTFVTPTEWNEPNII